MKHTPLRRCASLKRQRRKKSMRQQLQPLFNTLIRQRDGGCCLRGYDGHVCGGPLQCSHIYPRGQYPLLALFPLNATSICWRGHWWWHHNPMDAHRWLRSQFPRDWLDQLEAMKIQSLSRKQMTKEQIFAEWHHYGLR